MNGIKIVNNDCEHCYHDYRGPIHMVIPDGHVVQKCCKCEMTRTVHIEHSETRQNWRGRRR